MMWGDFLLAALVALVTFLNVGIFAALFLRRREEPRKIEVIVRSVFAGAVVEEEHIFVEGASDEPVELTLVLDEREQMREFL